MSGRALGMRFFVFEPDGTLRRVSSQSINRLVSRRGAVPQFSGQRLRDAEVIVELEDKRPVRIVKMNFGYWVLDSAGMFDPSDQLRLERASMALRKKLVLPWSSNVVHLAKIRKAKQVIAASKWKASDQEVAQIVGEILPEHRVPGTRRPTFIRITVRSSVPD